MPPCYKTVWISGGDDSIPGQRQGVLGPGRYVTVEVPCPGGFDSGTFNFGTTDASIGGNWGGIWGGRSADTDPLQDYPGWVYYLHLQLLADNQPKLVPIVGPHLAYYIWLKGQTRINPPAVFAQHCPPIGGTFFTSCSDNEIKMIQTAWGELMNDIVNKVSLMQFYLGGCNSAFDDMLRCLMNIASTDFSNPGNIPVNDKITIQCMKHDDHAGYMNPDGTLELNKDVVFNTYPGHESDWYLKATMLHELVHHCNNNINPGSSSELDSLFMENLFYAPKPWDPSTDPIDPTYPIGIGIYKNNKPFYFSDGKLCNESDAYKAANTKPPFAPEGKEILRSDYIGWNMSTGDAWLYCDDGTKLDLTLPGIISFNPFPTMDPLPCP